MPHHKAPSCCTFDSARWHWWLSANMAAASRMERELEGSGVSPQSALAMSRLHRVDVENVVLLVAQVPRLLSALDAASTPLSSDAVPLMTQLRDSAVRHTAQQSPQVQAELMPAGLASLPPNRPPSFDLAQIAPDTLREFVVALEGNASPMSGPDSEYPADPIFRVLLEALNTLGTRSLTMAELQAVIASDVGWGSPAAGGIRQAQDFELVFNVNKGLASPHELHKFFGGFKNNPSGGERFSPGWGGEHGLFARVTDEFDPENPDNWGAPQEIFRAWARHPLTNQRVGPEAVKFWADETKLLVESDVEEVRDKLAQYAGLGYFADPVEAQALGPSVDSLLAHPPNSPERVEAANTLTSRLLSRRQASDTVSVSAATAEMHLLQTVYRHLQNEGISVRNPAHKLDVVALYGLYRQLSDSGQLITREEMARWLTVMKLPHVP